MNSNGDYCDMKGQVFGGVDEESMNLHGRDFWNRPFFGRATHREFDFRVLSGKNGWALKGCFIAEETTRVK